MAVECPECKTKNPDSQSFCGECGTSLTPMAGPAFTKTMETPREELTTGSTFAGRYQIIEELGKGGMGKVYKAVDNKLKEKVALKLIKPEIVSDKKTLERFSNELKIARKIVHKNVGRMYELMEEKGAHFITMEYVSGQDLKGLIRQSAPLSIAKTIRTAKQICDGLAEAHKLGIIHRDLKPSNIMIDREGNARIMDFGIARSLKGKGITGAGVMIGTPEYMSPEQVEAKDVDQRSDIYSLGIILYEMATGQLPFEADTPFAVGIMQKSETPKNPKELNSQISDDLNQVILKCLEKDKESRYQSAGEVRSELESIEKGIPTTEREAPKRTPLTSKEITVSFSTKKLIIPASAVAMLILIAVLLIWSPWSQNGVIPALSGKPSLAILYFENNSGKKELDHWRSGLCEMLITDLSQSKYISVLSGDRIYSLLERSNLLDKEKYSTEDLRRVAAQGGANHILRGNYITAGDTFIINISLLRADTGEIISSLREEGSGEESVTDSVDSITRKIKSELNISAELIASDIDRDVGEVTTSSPEAYKYYLEGIRYDLKGDYRKVIEYMEKAVAVDPEFASAYRAMSWAYGNMRYNAESDRFIEKALELSNRLSDREKYNIRADFYLNSEKTYDKAKEALESLLKLYPDDISGNNALGNYYSRIGEHKKAVEYYEICKKAGSEDVVIYTNKARSYRSMGLFDKAEEVLRSYIDNISDSAFIRRNLSMNFRYQGKYDLALEEANKAFSLDPLSWDNRLYTWDLYFFTGDLEKAEEESRKLLEKKESVAKIIGNWFKATLALHQGQFEQTKQIIQQNLKAAERLGQNVWARTSYSALAGIELGTGNLERALDELEKHWQSAVEDKDFSDQRQNLYTKAQVYIAMESLDKAQDTADDLKGMIEQQMNKRIMNLYYHLMGLIAHEKKNYAQAIEYYKKGMSLIDATSGMHITFSNSLGSAYFEKKDFKNALTQYERITKSSLNRQSYAIYYARSFFMLGKIYEAQEKNSKAIENFERFLSLWKNADPGLPEVEEAKTKLDQLKKD